MSTETCSVMKPTGGRSRYTPLAGAAVANCRWAALPSSARSRRSCFTRAVSTLASQLGVLVEQHKSYPILHYYHSEESEDASATALALLVALQYAVAWLQTRWSFFMGVVTNPPQQLYFRGAFLREAMRRQRVTEAELEAAVRKEKLGSMDEVEAIILESSGEFSVIADVGDGSALGEEVDEQIRRRTGEAGEGRP